MKISNRHTLIFIFLVFSCLFSRISYGAELKAYVDRNLVQMGQFIQFSVTLSGKSSSHDPDFSVLRQDFDIVSNTSRSSQTQIINGNISSSTTWSINITPKKDGAIVIPPIKLAGLSSDAITVVVGKAPDKEFADAYFETHISAKEVYVQAQIKLDLKLFIRMSDLSNSKLDELRIPKAKIFPMGEARQSEVLINGIRYYQIEKSYFIFPEHSGELEIPSVNFSAVVNEGSRFSRYGSRRKISAASDKISIKVKGIPDGFPKGATWLPAEQLILAESIKPTENLKLGEPITRTIITKAAGLPVSALPPITLEDIEGVKIYPDQGKTDEQFDTKNLQATRSDSFALIANTSGNLVLPAHKLPWWDTKLDKLRYAELESKTLTIDAGNPDSSRMNLQDDTGNQDGTPTTNPDNKTGFSEKQLLVSLLALVFMWCATVFGFLINIRSMKRKFSQHETVQAQESKGAAERKTSTPIKTLENACRNNDSRLARQALLDWANTNTFHHANKQHTIKGLSQLAELIKQDQNFDHSELVQALHNLDASLYKQSSEKPDLALLLKSFQTWIKQEKKHNTQDEKGKKLSHLYSYR